MIKFVMAALWIAAVTVGSVYYSFNIQQGTPEKPEPGFFGGLDYIRTEMISVPLLRDRKVQGYFLARLVYTVEPAKLKKLSLPAETLLMDQVYSYLYANPEVDFSNRANLDLDALRAGIRDSVNARLGDKLVHEVLIEQLDFLTREDIRDNTSRRRAAAQGAAGKLPPPENGGH
jgi:hypothetical protein